MRLKLRNLMSKNFRCEAWRSERKGKINTFPSLNSQQLFYRKLSISREKNKKKEIAVRFAESQLFWVKL